MTSDRKGSMGRATRFAIGLLLYAVALPVHAATITVTNTNDSGPGSLRQALAVANDGDTIVFAVTGTIGLTSGELLVGTNITISGPGAASLTVNGNAKSRVFHIGSGRTVTISGLTITNGNANNQPVLDGGGMYNDHATLTLSNCTISDNSAQSYGGGINNVAGLTVTSTTFSGNSASFGGSIAIGNPVTVSIGDTVLNAGKMGGNIYNDGGTVVSHGYNLSSDDGGGYLNGPGDQINTNPLLGPLQDNGGPTFTHALLPDSPAIDTGDPNFTPPPFFDQRGPGYPRVVNGRIDKGSFEVQAPSPTPTATPCASVGSWTEQAPYPIAVSGHAVVSVGGNVYSFGGIVNNAAITNAYKYSPTSNTWTPIASLPAPRGWFSGTTDGTYVYLLGGVDQNFNTTGTLWRYDPVSNKIGRAHV